MTKAEVQVWLRAEPFKPFRVHTSNGRSFDVLHPENAGLGRTVLFVYDVSQDTFSNLSLLHVTEFEELPATVDSVADDVS